MRHSAYSASGSESATMPPPAPSQHRPAANSKVRMATLSSRPADRGAVADGAGVGLAGGQFELVDDLERADLRRTGDRAGREGGADQVVVGDAVAEGPLDGRDQVPHAGVGLGVEQVGDPDRAREADPAEVVADQVHDHHVLGPVLGRPLELGQLRGRLRRIAVAPRGALDRLGRDRVAGPAQEQLGRERGHGGARYPGRRRRRARRSADGGGRPGRCRAGGRRNGGDADEGRVGRLQFLRRLAEGVERVARELGLRPQADVGLEDIALADVLHRPRDRLPVAGRPRGQPERPERVVTAPRRLGRAGGQVGEAAFERRRAGVRPQRLEEPLPRRPVPHQHVVVPAEPPRGQPARPGRGERLAARAVAQVPDPAAAEGAVLPRPGAAGRRRPRAGPGRCGRRPGRPRSRRRRRPRFRGAPPDAGRRAPAGALRRARAPTAAADGSPRTLFGRTYQQVNRDRWQPRRAGRQIALAPAVAAHDSSEGFAIPGCGCRAARLPGWRLGRRWLHAVSARWRVRVVGRPWRMRRAGRGRGRDRVPFGPVFRPWASSCAEGALRDPNTHADPHRRPAGGVVTVGRWRCRPPTPGLEHGCAVGRSR